MNEISFKFEIDKDYRKETFNRLSNEKFILIIKIIILILLIWTIVWFIWEKQILWYQIFLFWLLMRTLQFGRYNSYKKIKKINKEISVKITKDQLQIENGSGIHIYSYDKFKYYFFWERYYYLYNDDKKRELKMVMIFPKNKFTEEDKKFFEIIMGTNYIINKKII